MTRVRPVGTHTSNWTVQFDITGSVDTVQLVDEIAGFRGGALSGVPKA